MTDVHDTVQTPAAPATALTRHPHIHTRSLLMHKRHPTSGTITQTILRTTTTPRENATSTPPPFSPPPLRPPRSPLNARIIPEGAAKRQLAKTHVGTDPRTPPLPPPPSPCPLHSRLAPPLLWQTPKLSAVLWRRQAPPPRRRWPIPGQGWIWLGYDR